MKSLLFVLNINNAMRINLNVNLEYQLVEDRTDLQLYFLHLYSL